MAAPKGNKNAIGNKGGKDWGVENKEKAVKLKGLTLDYLMKAMQGTDEVLKEKVALRIAPLCLPQVIVGDDESPLVVKVINYARDNTTVQLPTEKLPTGLPISSTEVQARDMEQKSWEVQDSPKPTDKPDAT